MFRARCRRAMSSTPQSGRRSPVARRSRQAVRRSRGVAAASRRRWTSRSSRSPPPASRRRKARTSAARWPMPRRSIRTCAPWCWSAMATGTPAIRPPQAAMRLRMRDVPVFAVPLGSESRLPDVELSSFDVPTFAVAGKPLRIPFTIESSLPRDEPATLEMKSSTGEVITKAVVIPAMSRLQDVIVWKPEKPGEIKLTLTVPKTGGERDPREQHASKRRFPCARSSCTCWSSSRIPRWEYRYLRNALERDPGVEVNCAALPSRPRQARRGPRLPRRHSRRTSDLAKYDVVFLGDVGTDTGQLTARAMRAAAKAGARPGGRPRLHARACAATRPRCKADRAGAICSRSCGTTRSRAATARRRRAASR